jgi:hypothetical protein
MCETFLPLLFGHGIDVIFYSAMTFGAMVFGISFLNRKEKDIKNE